MPRLKIYLAFDDAYKAMKYYEDTFGATITRHMPVTKELKEQFKLDVVARPFSTFDGEFSINGVYFGCSDNFDDVKNYTNTFSTVVEYSRDENEMFEEVVKKIHKAKGIINYEQLSKEEGYRLICFTDKYNISWSFTIIDD